MGEWIGASFRVGGKLKEEHVDELIDLLDAKDLRLDWDEKPTRENITSDGVWANSEINYGNLDELRDFANEHRLHWEHWSESGPDWDASTVRYNPDTDETFECIGQGDEALSIATIKQLGNWAELMNYLHRMKQPLPPLEIVPGHQDICSDCGRDYRGEPLVEGEVCLCNPTHPDYEKPDA